MQITDTDIRTFMRSHLARHRIDMTKLQLRVFNGTVRMSGEIQHLGQHKAVTMSTVENLEREVIATSGVRHAFFEFENLKRTVDGAWEEVNETLPEPEPEVVTVDVDGPREEFAHQFVDAISIKELLEVQPTRRSAAA